MYLSASALFEKSRTPRKFVATLVANFLEVSRSILILLLHQYVKIIFFIDYNDIRLNNEISVNLYYYYAFELFLNFIIPVTKVLLD